MFQLAFPLVVTVRLMKDSLKPADGNGNGNGMVWIETVKRRNPRWLVEFGINWCAQSEKSVEYSERLQCPRINQHTAWRHSHVVRSHCVGYVAGSIFSPEFKSWIWRLFVRSAKKNVDWRFISVKYKKGSDDNLLSTPDSLWVFVNGMKRVNYQTI